MRATSYVNGHPDSGADDRSSSSIRCRRRLDRLYRSCRRLSRRAAPGRRRTRPSACYGKGGEEPTVTDAQVVLGRLDADKMLGGDLPLDPDLAHKAVEAKVAKPLGLSVKDAALGIIKVINSNMALAIRSDSVARGIDPREFALVPSAAPPVSTGVARSPRRSRRRRSSCRWPRHHRGDGTVADRHAVRAMRARSSCRSSTWIRPPRPIGTAVIDELVRTLPA